MGVKGIRRNKEQSPLMNDVDGWIMRIPMSYFVQISWILKN